MLVWLLEQAAAAGSPVSAADDTAVFVCRTANTSRWVSVICFCAVALSLAAKQQHDMVRTAAYRFLLSARGLSQQAWADCSPPPPLLISQHHDPYLRDWCAALLCLLKLPFLLVFGEIALVETEVGHGFR